MTTSTQDVHVRPIEDGERPWLARHLIRVWRSTDVVSRGHVHDAASLPALVGIVDGEIAGVATYRVTGDRCELVTLDALVERRGVGSALLHAVADTARQAGCRSLWVITTNDNREAQRFYKHHDMRLVAVHEGTLKDARRHKPSIPLIGASGIAMRDEVEFELDL